MLIENYYGEYIVIFNPIFYYYNKINFQTFEVKVVHDTVEDENNFGKEKTNSYTIAERTLNKRTNFTIEDLKLILNEIRED